MGELFGDGQKLRQAGWTPAGKTIRGEPLWKDPHSNALMGQRDALHAVESREIVEQDKDE